MDEQERVDEQRDEQREKDGATEDAEGAKNEDNTRAARAPARVSADSVQTGAAGGGNSEPMRGRNPSGEGAAAHGGAPNEETGEN